MDVSQNAGQKNIPPSSFFLPAIQGRMALVILRDTFRGATTAIRLILFVLNWIKRKW